jgi:DnaK suppressor protein
MAQSRTSTSSKSSSSKAAPAKGSAGKQVAAKPAAKVEKAEKAPIAAKPAPKTPPPAAPVKKEPPVAAKPVVKEKEPTVAHAEPMTMPKIPAAAPVEERPAPTTTMNKKQLERFRALLEEKRDDIIKKAKQTLDEDMTLDANDLPDEMDLASSEYLQSFTFRLRGREKSFLDKINKALERIDNGTFGICEECGEEISVKRLEARPETTLCIRCKEDQERAEKDYG